MPDKQLEIARFPNGMTVRELKELIASWPEIDPVTLEECGVWVGNDRGTSNQVKMVWPLNKKYMLSDMSSDMLFETDVDG